MNIIHGSITSAKRYAVNELIKIFKNIEAKIDESRVTPDDIFFTGYPLLDSPEGSVNLDALLLSKAFGLVAFELICDEEKVPQDIAAERQDDIYNQLHSKFSKHKELTDRRQLKFKIETITVDLFDKIEINDDGNDILVTKNESEVIATINSFEVQPIEDAVFKKLKSVLQGVSKLRPIRRRLNVKKNNSRGAIIKEIEKQIANLDIYQNKAIVETTDGPQRITGLAGTGKTIVLAGKVAYLHALDPELEIAVTFYSRSLYQQYKELIRRLYWEYQPQEPDWSKIHVLHSWGGQSSPGMYFKAAKENGLTYSTYNEAIAKYGRENPFEFCCNELLSQIKKPRPIFDVLMIDEAQDMPRSFFEICHLLTKAPHRLIWAYDELQQLNKIHVVPQPEILFGNNADGSPRYKFKTNVEGPDDDIVLKVCYRNPKEIITTAHALGLAVYSQDGPIQMIEDRAIWERIGYKVSGALSPGNTVTIEREVEASPSFLNEFLNKDDIIQYLFFDTDDAQAEWIASEIQKNISEEELEPVDVLVIYPEPLTLNHASGKLRTKLAKMGISTHIAGAADASEYFIDGSIAVSHIFRAKGNEAAMVYVMNSELCASGTELIKKRNILFTAVTRARAWARICGVGQRMEKLIAEINQVEKNDFALKFEFPENMEQRRRLHREFSESEKDKKRKHVDTFSVLKKALEKGEIDPGDLSEKELFALRKLLFKDPS